MNIKTSFQLRLVSGCSDNIKHNENIFNSFK